METEGMSEQPKHPLTKYRDEKNLTRAAFGDLIGASRTMVWKWENGHALPRPTYMQKIFEATDRKVGPNAWYGMESAA